MKYTAFGEVRSTSGVNGIDYRYTGQREETEIGLYFYKARFYDPALARFVQADTIVPGPGSPQSWDRYAYVKNNPVRFSDPSGHYEFEDNDDIYVTGYSIQQFESVHQYQGITPYCGPYSLAMVENLLTGNSISGNYVNDFLVDEWLKFNNLGITRNELAKGASKLLPNNTVTSQKNGTIEQLINNVDAGELTIVGVSWQTSEKILNLTLFKNEAKSMFKDVTIGHWMVVVGYNEVEKQIIFLDPGYKQKSSDEFTRYSYTEFNEFWLDKTNMFIGSGDMIIFH